MKLIKSLMVLFCVFFTSCISAQTPPYYHYTSNAGLSSSIVYDMAQDKSGFIWIGTSNGLNRFDSKQFKIFRIKDGLNSNAITSISADESGVLYIGNHEKGINIFKNGKIKNFRSKIESVNFSTIQLIGNHEDLYNYSNAFGINVFKKHKAKGYDYNVKPHPIYVNRIGKLKNDQFIILSNSGLYEIADKKLQKLKVYNLPNDEMISFALCSDGSYLIGSVGRIFKIKNNRVIKLYNLTSANDRVFKILSDSQGNIWFSLFGKGFYTIPNGTNRTVNISAKINCENTQISNFLEDTEGNIWVATFGKGLFCLNNLYIQNYSDEDGLSNNNVNSITKHSSGKLIFGTINGVNTFESGLIKRLKYNSGKDVIGYITHVQSFDNYIYVNLSSNKPEAENINFDGNNFRVIYSQSFCKTNNGYYLYGNVGNRIFVQSKFGSENELLPSYVFGDSAYLNRVNVIIRDSLNNIWCGTNLGICKLSNMQIKDKKVIWEKKFFKNSSVLNAKIYAIHQDRKNNIWVAGQNGVSCINLNDYSFIDYNDISGCDLTSSTAIVSDYKNRVWIGNLNGLYLLDNGNIKYLNNQTGLPSNEVISLFYDNAENFLYVGTSSGVSFLNMNLFDKHKPNPLHIKIYDIKVGDSIYTNFHNLVFEPNQHDVKINFRAINFSSPKLIKYKFKLNDDDWKETNNNFLDLISLKPGSYKIALIASSQNTSWSKPVHISFVIQPLFTETIWFVFVIICFVVLILLGIVFWRMKLNAKKNQANLELNERINDLKHQALSAMMNPHFIFNSLNSVQYLINNHKNEEANNYIAMMANLIRKNLDTAGNGFILLSEEIKRLNMYLDLEKLRFQEKFSYEICIDKEIETENILIPNMIIQPFVENSLWHGIINCVDKGLLKISFGFENVEIDLVTIRSLIIKITDNGIGIKEAQKQKKEDHISKGIQIIEERLQLLSTKMEIPKPIIIEDLNNRGKLSHGTEVIISLPQPLYKIISEQ